MGLRGRGGRAASICALAALMPRLLCDVWHMFGELRAVMVCVHKKRQQNDYIRFSPAPIHPHPAITCAAR
jgi:hypothetical protein